MSLIRMITYFVTLLLLTGLMGCSTSITPPPDEPTMAEAYQMALRDQTGTGNSSENVLDTARAQSDAVSFKAHQVPALSGADDFALIPNPPILVFIAPHVAGRGQLPIAGYWTKLPMYTQNYYALPGEVVA